MLSTLFQVKYKRRQFLKGECLSLFFTDFWTYIPLLKKVWLSFLFFLINCNPFPMVSPESEVTTRTIVNRRIIIRDLLRDISVWKHTLLHHNLILSCSVILTWTKLLKIPEIFIRFSTLYFKPQLLIKFILHILLLKNSNVNTQIFPYILSVTRQETETDGKERPNLT